MARLLALCVIAMALLAPPAAAVDSTDGDDGGRGSRCRGFDSQNDHNERSGATSHRSSPDYYRHQLCLDLNQTQVIGTHNSYKQPIPPPLLEVLGGLFPDLALSLEYSHAPLPEQFDEQEVRQIEIDVYHDPDGGLFAARPALDALGLPNETPPELLEPGFKVLHINDIDFNSSCLTLVDCLTEVRRWSRSHRGHLPIMILIELKTDPIPDPLNLGFVTPLPIGPTELDALDAEIRSVFKDRHTIDPEEVRGRYKTLEEAVLAGNWPSLWRSRNKVLFTMVNGGEARDDYLAGHPSLDGRVMFTNSTPGQPDAAFLNVDDAITNRQRIQDLVAAGYIVRTRADVDTIEGRTGDTTRLEAALASGAQWVSTDYPVPGRAFVDYSATIPEGDPARCNPVNTGPRCRNDRLERIRIRRR
ncbi:MAG: phosphatidylinositol-specific phospholipase C1-like protein [Acidimicrobiales bacterium]